MATDKKKFKNKESDKKMGKSRKSTETSSLSNESTGTGNISSEEKLSRSKAEIDQKNSEFEPDRESRRTGPTTGGYGDQHDPKRYREPQNNQFDEDRDHSGTWDQNRYRNPGNQQNENRDRDSERPYGEESYRLGERGEDRSYKGNEYGSPYKGDYEPGNRNRNEDQDREANRGSGRYDKERHLRNEPTERERGDRDREW